MTPQEIELVSAVGGLSIFPGTSQKRFVRNMAALAAHDPDRELSDRQRHYLQIIGWRFRRQMPDHLVPEQKPPDLPLQKRVAAPRIPAQRKAASAPLPTFL